MPTPPARRRPLGPGRKLDGDRFTLLRKLGEGGNGVVWLARHENLQTDVAIKFPSNSDQQSVFEDEIRSHVPLSNQHPNIVSILDVSRCEGLTFVVMQYLAGGSLKDHIQLTRNRDATSGIFSNTRWITAIADALDFIHSQGIIHRDVKPANILLDTSSSTYLSDFGIASSADASMNSDPMTQIVGSLPYIAPEVLYSASDGPRADQFALGVSAYEAITKRRPFSATSATELGEVFRAGTIIRPSQWVPGLPPGIDDAILRAISFDATKRFATCSEFAAELHRDWEGVLNAWSRQPEAQRLSSKIENKPLPTLSVNDNSIDTEDDLIPSEEAPKRKKIQLSRILQRKRDQED